MLYCHQKDKKHNLVYLQEYLQHTNGTYHMVRYCVNKKTVFLNRDYFLSVV
jgi:hypothetical protein